MYYEINVSLNGKHLFATADRSITGSKELDTVYGIMKEKFTEPEGYKLTVTKCNKMCVQIDMNGGK